MQRRPVLEFLAAGLAWPLSPTHAAPVAEGMAQTAPLLRAGGVVLALRHALAPGTFDPPGFRLDDCSTQRNLSDDGRAQAQRGGQALAALGLRPARVRSSPWCRCMDSARLAFGSAEPWAALGSPRASVEATNAQSLQALRSALAQVTTAGKGFEAWVTHQFVLSDLAGVATASGEGLVLRAHADGSVQVLARLVA